MICLIIEGYAYADGTTHLQPVANPHSQSQRAMIYRFLSLQRILQTESKTLRCKRVFGAVWPSRPSLPCQVTSILAKFMLEKLECSAPRAQGAACGGLSPGCLVACRAWSSRLGNRVPPDNPHREILTISQQVLRSTATFEHRPSRFWSLGAWFGVESRIAAVDQHSGDFKVSIWSKPGSPFI